MSQHHFNVQFAEKYGLREAIILNHIDFWLSININNTEQSVYFPETYPSRYWVYFKPEAIEKHFPYFSSRKFTAAANNLVEANVLDKEQFGGTDRTNYYTFTEEFLLSHKEELLSFLSYEKQNLVVGRTENGECLNNNINKISIPKGIEGSNEPSHIFLSEEEKEYIPVIEYWNSKASEIKGPSVHKLPETLDEPVSKTIKSIVGSVKGITNGNFYIPENFNNNSFYSHTEKIDIKFIYEGIDVLMNQFKTYKNIQKLPKSLKNYLLTNKGGNNTFDKFSPFYRDFFSKRDYGVIGHDIPKDIIDMYKKLFGANLTKEWEMGIDTMLKKLYTVFERNQYLSKYSQKYAIHLGSEKAFFETHYKFLKANFYHMDDFHIGMLKNHGKIWERFTAWLYDNYSIKLDLSADQQRMMKQRYKILSIKKGVHSEEEFDEDNNLIN